MLRDIDRSLFVVDNIDDLESLIRFCKPFLKDRVVEVLYVIDVDFVEFPTTSDPNAKKIEAKREIDDILEKLEMEAAVFVYFDDLIGRVLSIQKEPEKSLVIADLKLKERINLTDKLSSCILFVKDNINSVKNLYFPIKLTKDIDSCISDVKSFFDGDISLVYDYPQKSYDDVKMEDRKRLQEIKERFNLPIIELSESYMTEVDFVLEEENIFLHLIDTLNKSIADIVTLCRPKHTTIWIENIRKSLLIIR
jgi:hypothetical protein